MPQEFDDFRLGHFRIEVFGDEVEGSGLLTEFHQVVDNAVSKMVVIERASEGPHEKLTMLQAHHELKLLFGLGEFLGRLTNHLFQSELPASLVPNLVHEPEAALGDELNEVILLPLDVDRLAFGLLGEDSVGRPDGLLGQISKLVEGACQGVAQTIRLLFEVEIKHCSLMDLKLPLIETRQLPRLTSEPRKRFSNESRNSKFAVLKSSRVIPTPSYNSTPLKNRQSLQLREQAQSYGKGLQREVHARTKAGTTVGGMLKTNQDSHIITKVAKLDLLGVCDGHGKNGHLVSQFLKQNFPKNLDLFLYGKDLNNPEVIIWALEKACIETNQQLIDQPFDTYFSGSTMVIVALSQQNLYCANVGDSRAIIIGRNGFKYTATPLSVDQKPSLPQERLRVEKAGGRVDCARDDRGRPQGPLRVWLDKVNIPGLAMTRSFGDQAGLKAGIIAIPEIKYTKIRAEDHLIVIGSDGLWEFIQNQQVVKHIVPYYQKGQLNRGCGSLIRQSSQRWKINGHSRDDITVIALSLF